MNSWDRLLAWLYGDRAVVSSSNNPGTGALIDTREPEQKAADIHFTEIVASAAVVQWVAKAASSWRRFPVFNQASTSACVAFTMAKLLGIMRWLKDGIFVTFSPGYIYLSRVNAPVEGMIGTDAYAIAARGVTLDAVVPSQNITEAAINALVIPEYAYDIASLFKLNSPNPILPPTGDIDAIASIIQQTGKGVMVWFFFTAREWGIGNGSDFNVPQILDNLSGATDPRALRHSVSAVDFTLYNGKKALVIEDSAQFGGYARRVVTEDFFKARNFFAAYPMNLQQVRVENVTDATRLKYVFSKSLYFIPWDDAHNRPADPILNATQETDVKALQSILQQLTDKAGNTFFPTNVTPTGYYGGLTAQAIYRWQTDRKVAYQPSLDKLAGQIFGDASRAQIMKDLS